MNTNYFSTNPNSDVIELSPSNFIRLPQQNDRVSYRNISDITRDSTTRVVCPESTGKPGFVLFYAHWCGHCKRMKDTWNMLGRLKSEDIFVGALNCANDSSPLYSETSERLGVKGYPTIKYIYPDGHLEDYSGGRDIEDLVKFLIRRGNL
jgi:thioredoxin-like negative regulator of GroEL